MLARTDYGLFVLLYNSQNYSGVILTTENTNHSASTSSDVREDSGALCNSGRVVAVLRRLVHRALFWQEWELEVCGPLFLVKTGLKNDYQYNFLLKVCWWGRVT